MERKALQYTIKIYGEGLTEWFYFESLRTNSRFRFTMEPEIPKNSRSSYKQNLKLIDTELKKKPQERADAIFLVIDTDVMAKDRKQYAEYLLKKERYKKFGVTFIESHPCIELWFLYHLADKFARTSYDTYEALRPEIEKVLPRYEKTRRYYQRDTFFRKNIIDDMENRTIAIQRAILSCEYEATDGEAANYTEMFKAIHFFRLLQKSSEIRMLLSEKLRKPIPLEQDVHDHRSLGVFVRKGDERLPLCTLKYDKATLRSIMTDGTTVALDDRFAISMNDEIVGKLAETTNALLGGQ